LLSANVSLKADITACYKTFILLKMVDLIKLFVFVTDGWAKWIEWNSTILKFSFTLEDTTEKVYKFYEPVL
jgi:hypothetical protein